MGFSKWKRLDRVGSETDNVTQGWGGGGLPDTCSPHSIGETGTATWGDGIRILALLPTSWVALGKAK